MNQPNKKRALLVSDVPMFTIKEGIGIMVLEETLKGFLKRGYEIDLIYPSYDKHSLISSVDGLTGINDYSFFVPVYFKLIKTRYVSYLTRALSWIYFWRKLKKLALEELQGKKYDLHYGIGTLGSFLIHRPYLDKNVCKISRHLGVASLYKRYKNPIKRMLTFPFVLGYRVDSDLYIITDDGTMGDRFFKTVNKKNRNLYFPRNGINKKIFAGKKNGSLVRKELQISPQSRILLTVNRLSHQKRVDRLIKIMKYLPSDDLYLIVVGDGELRTKLEKLAVTEAVNEQVIFTGALPHEKAAEYLHACDIFLSVNETSNGGNTCIEAMTAGCCIVTIDNEETAGFFPDEGAVLIEPNAIHTLPEVVKSLLNDEEKRKIMGEKAKLHAEKTFLSWEKRISAEMDIIEKQIEKKRMKNTVYLVDN